MPCAPLTKGTQRRHGPSRSHWTPLGGVQRFLSSPCRHLVPLSTQQQQELIKVNFSIIGKKSKIMVAITTYCIIKYCLNQPCHPYPHPFTSPNPFFHTLQQTFTPSCQFWHPLLPCHPIYLHTHSMIFPFNFTFYPPPH
jgi:hypothetical protein